MPFSFLETARNQLEPSQESTAHDPWQSCLFLLKTAALKAKNVQVHCHVEDSKSNLSTTLLASPHGADKPFPHLHIECLIDSDPFRLQIQSVIKEADEH
jgi:hypothetical protein